jgi:hypothetical protein
MGKNHLNEQWQYYWVTLFEKESYLAFDLIRPVIWEDGEIPVWYKQNTLVYVNKSRVTDLKVNADQQRGYYFPYNVVHPELYLIKANQLNVKTRKSHSVPKKILEKIKTKFVSNH